MTLLKLPLSLHWCQHNLMNPCFIWIVAASSRHRQFKATSVDSFAWSLWTARTCFLQKVSKCVKMCQLRWGGKFQLASTLDGKVGFLLKSVRMVLVQLHMLDNWLMSRAKCATQPFLKKVDNDHLGFIQLSWVQCSIVRKIDDFHQTWENVCSWTTIDQLSWDDAKAGCFATHCGVRGYGSAEVWCKGWVWQHFASGFPY